MDQPSTSKRIRAGSDRRKSFATGSRIGSSNTDSDGEIITQPPRRKSVFRNRESVLIHPDTVVIRTAAPCPKWCGKCLYENIPLDDHPTYWESFVDILRCPPHRYPARVMYFIFAVSCIWITLWGMFGDDMYPGGLTWTLFFVEVVAFMGGEMIKLFRLPPLFGMLLTGILIGNLPIHASILGSEKVMKSSTVYIRTTALGIILTRAGLGLNPTALRRLSFVCFRLAFGPCLVECVATSIAANQLLDMDWMYCFMLGFTLAAVSPAVVVPGMLNVQRQHLSVEKGLPTLLIAASSIDDVLAIGGFGVCMSITFSKEDVLMAIFHGPIEVCIGLLYGTVVGILLWYFPDPLSGRARYVAWLRMLLLFVASTAGLFGSRKIGFPGAGAMSCMVLSFVSAYNWREDLSSAGLREISHQYARLWLFFQPILFGLVGTEIRLAEMDKVTMGKGLGVLGIGLAFRSVTAGAVIWGCGFTFKERIFVALAWLPKATVQAAMGPVALDHVRSNNLTGVVEEYATNILQISALSILISAPIGAIGIALTARFLLTHDDDAASTSAAIAPLTATESESHLLQDMMMKSQEHHLQVPETKEPKDDRVSSLVAVPKGHEYREFLAGLQEAPIPQPKRHWWKKSYRNK